MAFGINRQALRTWKKDVQEGRIAFITHFWLDDRFPGCKTVTKVGCADYQKLINWGTKYGLRKEWIHQDPSFPHFDLFGERQKEILEQEEQWEQIKRFNL